MSDDSCAGQAKVLGTSQKHSAEARPLEKFIQQSRDPKSSDELCTGRGVINGRAQNPSEKAAWTVGKIHLAEWSPSII